jgi:hypothetical protein
MSETEYDDEWKIGLSNFYDFMYTFVILSLLSQIFSGIIIDTFAQLRTEYE